MLSVRYLAHVIGGRLSLSAETPGDAGLEKKLLVVRPYGDADLDAVVDLWFTTWHTTFPDLCHPDPIETWRRRFIQELCPLGDVWVAASSGTIVGFLVAFVEDHYLDQIWVDPHHQHGGVGAALLKRAKVLSPRGLGLHTLQRNSAARSFYERHGFVPGQTGINRFNGEPNIFYHWPGAT